MDVLLLWYALHDATVTAKQSPEYAWHLELSRFPPEAECKAKFDLASRHKDWLLHLKIMAPELNPNLAECLTEQGMVCEAYELVGWARWSIYNRGQWGIGYDYEEPSSIARLRDLLGRDYDRGRLPDPLPGVNIPR